jgi:guanosine-3',5'-bis(diphosphate) 3'-pyrophosphohydrolase
LRWRHCATWKLDAQALMAALLHDAMEDCGVTKADLIDRFGAPVAELVDGLTKLDKLQFNTREENQAESFRKMLLAMARDVRVILIKLADRTHNMRTLADMPRSKWGRISSETLEIYAPIAHRLGLNQTYRELQDLSFRYLHPWRYANPVEGHQQVAQPAAGSGAKGASGSGCCVLPHWHAGSSCRT